MVGKSGFQVVALALAFLSGCQAAGPADDTSLPPSSRTCVEAARAASAGQGDNQVVIAACTDAILAGPEDRLHLAGLLTVRGVAYRNLGAFDAALADLDEAVRLDPESVSTANMRAWTYRQMGDYPAAEAAYSEILKDPSRRSQVTTHAATWQAYLSRCVVRQDLNRFGLAVEDCEIALEGDRNSDSLYFAARAYNRVDRCGEAVPLLQAALEEEDVMARVFEELAFAHSCEGDDEKALSVLEGGLRQFPGDDSLLAMRRWIAGV